MNSCSGLPFGLFKGQICQIWPFWNCLPEIKWFGHLAIFWPFLTVDKNSIFWALFWTNLIKFQTFYEILHFNSAILTNFWMKFGLCLAYLIFLTWHPCLCWLLRERILFSSRLCVAAEFVKTETIEKKKLSIFFRVCHSFMESARSTKICRAVKPRTMMLSCYRVLQTNEMKWLFLSHFCCW